ncbi:MAG: lipocalin-like domain-containing protein [Bacteroidaceae bacterium]|nr:lipocalin-like domain-containing protein [Bacteroidaceae bacterium]
MYKHSPCIFCILSLFCALCVVASCDKMPINGDLDGMWQLERVETSETILDTRTHRVYLSIQLHLAQWDDPTEGLTLYSHFRHEGDSLFFIDLSHASPHTATASDDTLVTSQEMADGLMKAWGIYDIHTRYCIRTLKTQNLQLEKADTIYYYKKF